MTHKKKPEKDEFNKHLPGPEELAKAESIYDSSVIGH